MIATRTELMTSRQCLRLAYWLVLMACVASCAFGCAHVESGAVYVRGDYTIVSADADTSATLTVDASRTNPPSIWSVIFSAIAGLWR